VRILGLGRKREVAHTDVRRRERNMHGRISFPWIGGDLYCGKFIRGGLVDVGAAELYRKIFCYWRCFALTSLAILGQEKKRTSPPTNNRNPPCAALEFPEGTLKPTVLI